MNPESLERRKRIQETAMADTEFAAMLAEYEAAQTRFRKFADKMPRRLRNLLYSYPGMGYFLYHQMLNLVSETMIFPDEK